MLRDPPFFYGTVHAVVGSSVPVREMKSGYFVIKSTFQRLSVDAVPLYVDSAIKDCPNLFHSWNAAFVLLVWTQYLLFQSHPSTSGQNVPCALFSTGSSVKSHKNIEQQNWAEQQDSRTYLCVLATWQFCTIIPILYTETTALSTCITFDSRHKPLFRCGAVLR